MIPMDPLPAQTWITVLGWSGTGKTTLIVKLVGECARRGLSCACAKRARHPAAIAPEGKDSSLFLQAGAMASAYVGDSGAALFLPAPPDSGESAPAPGAAAARAYYAALLPEARVIILEGAEAEGAVRILVTGEEADPARIKRGFHEVDIVVSRNASLREAARARGIPAFDADRIAQLMDAVLAAAARKE